MSQIKCTNCGKAMPDTYSYCASCGCSLSLNTSTSAAVNSPWLSSGVLIVDIDSLPSYANMSEESIKIYSSYLDALKRIRTTNNMETYFSSYDFIFDSLKGLKKHAEFKKRKAEYDDYTAMFIIKTWNSTLEGASQLKTEKGRINRIQKYFDKLESWSSYLSPIHISLIKHIKSEHKAIPLPQVFVKLKKNLLSSVEDIKNISSRDNISYELQRSATVFKNYNQLDLAIACLRKSNEIADSNNGMGTLLLEKDYFRLPEYIRLSGNEELAAKEEAAIYKKHPELGDKRISNLPRITSVIKKNRSDYVRVHTDTICEICSKYNRHVYSISGKSSKFPKIPDELIQNGGFCPNCITNISPYFDGISTPPPSFPVEEHHVTTTNQTEDFDSDEYNNNPSSPHKHIPLFDSLMRVALFVICLVAGLFGVHRFLVGKTKSGFVYLFTAGGFGIGWLVDLYMIYNGKFTDKNGNYI